MNSLSTVVNLVFVILAIGLPVLIFGGILLILFLFLGLPPLLRMYVKSTGKRASATILEKHYGRGSVYSGSSYNHNLIAQKVILKLEVHPADAAAYIAEDRFLAKSMDDMRLNVGCDLQVSIARNNPKRVVSLPETVTASAYAPVQARAGLAMANLAEQVAHGGSAGPEQVMAALQAQGVRTVTPPTADDPKAKLEELKELLNSGLITQQEFETKKAGILARI